MKSSETRYLWLDCLRYFVLSQLEIGITFPNVCEHLNTIIIQLNVKLHGEVSLANIWPWPVKKNKTKNDYLWGLM